MKIVSACRPISKQTHLVCPQLRTPIEAGSVSVDIKYASECPCALRVRVSVCPFVRVCMCACVLVCLCACACAYFQVSAIPATVHYYVIKHGAMFENQFYHLLWQCRSDVRSL